MRITLDESDLLAVINSYLRSAGFHRASHTLEEETKVTNYQYGKDINFARDLTMKGRWEDLKKFLAPMKKSNFDYERAMFEVDKQVFLEMLDAQISPVTSAASVMQPPSSEQLVVVLKDLEGRCSQEEFHGLCFCLTVKSLGNHPEYKAWTVYGGR